MKINYILTTFSPAMFGEKATSHIRIVSPEEASSYVDDSTKIVATRVSHERLARQQFPGAAEEVHRYAMLKPNVNALHIHYRGPQIPESGDMPVGGMVTLYLIEVDNYQDG
jgi:hypothetical protein